MSIEKRVTQAQDILKAFGFDEIRCNSRSAYTLLSLLGLKEKTPWKKSTNEPLGISGLMDWMGKHWANEYKTGTRESVRKHTIHQFVEAGFVAINESDPNRPVNSPSTSYNITTEALSVIRQFSTKAFDQSITAYLVNSPGLAAQYAAARKMARIPVTLPGGNELLLTPGGQNPLIADMIHEFCSRFIPGGEVLYVGDANSKMEHFDHKRIAQLGISVDQHGKLPDLVVYDKNKNWLFLMEAVFSGGPVDAKRHAELADLFTGSTAGLVYVSCFADRKNMKKFSADLAWETEAWCADAPSHMVHLNGDRFLGPHS